MPTSRCLMLMPLAFAAVLAGCDGSAPVAVGQTAWDRVVLISEAAEPIGSIEAPEGARVRVGDVVLRQDPGRVEAQLAQARAASQRAEARLAELRRGPRAERIREAQARLAGAESRRRNAERQLERISDLVQRGLATPAERDRALADRDSARAEADAVRADLEALLEGTTVEELQQAQAALAEARARERELGIVLDRLTVRAPRDGVVDALPFELGERPPAGATVAVLLAGELPHARVYVPEPYRVRVRPGATLPVRVDGIAGPLQGRVRFVASDPAFTPFFALTEHDRSRLAYLAEIDLVDAGGRDIPAGIPVQVDLSGIGDE